MQPKKILRKVERAAKDILVISRTWSGKSDNFYVIGMDFRDCRKKIIYVYRCTCFRSPKDAGINGNAPYFFGTVRLIGQIDGSTPLCVAAC